jgi:hypothetical protein
VYPKFATAAPDVSLVPAIAAVAEMSASTIALYVTVLVLISTVDASCAVPTDPAPILLAVTELATKPPTTAALSAMSLLATELSTIESDAIRLKLEYVAIILSY